MSAGRPTDPLDRIEAAVERWCSDPAIPDTAIPASPDDVLALVKVARAARAYRQILNEMELPGDWTEWQRVKRSDATHALDAALAELA